MLSLVEWGDSHVDFPDVLNEVFHRCLLLRLAGTVVCLVVVDPWNSVTYVNWLSLLQVVPGNPKDDVGRFRIDYL